MPDTSPQQSSCFIQDTYPMKDVYVNHSLSPLLIRHRERPRQRIFSGGALWRLLTPQRLADAAGIVGHADPRIRLLVALLRRHAPHPEAHCRRLGIRESQFVPPGNYPPVPCPRCDNVHHPHPADMAAPCPACRDRANQPPQAGGAELDRLLDAAARERLAAKHPDDFKDGVLSPGWKYNHDRVLRRDWAAAVNRLLMGLTYRRVAREFGCSTGVLHKRASERKAWENN